MCRSRRILFWIGLPLLLWTGCCGIRCVQGPIWGRVETRDAVARDDVGLYLYCRSHGFHGSYTADREHRLVATGERFWFPWMFGGIAPTACTLDVVHPLYVPRFENFEQGAYRRLAPILLEPWESVLARAEAGEDVAPLTQADLNRHVFELRHHYLEAWRRHPERLAPYLPALHEIYDRGLRSLAPMERDRFGSTEESLRYLKVLEEASGYQRPPAQRALFAAVESGDVAGVERSLDAGADPDAWDADGRAALHLAASAGRTAVVAALVDRGADIDRRREGLGNTPLLDAALEGQRETLLLLVARGADVRLGARGRTPLTASTRSGTDPSLFLALVEAGALEGDDAVRALQAASRGGRADLLREILARGLPPDASWGTSGFTALMLAALEGQPDTARLLIEAGADVNARAADGRTPRSMALQRDPPPRRRAEVLALLDAAGARE